MLARWIIGGLPVTHSEPTCESLAITSGQLSQSSRNVRLKPETG